MAGTLDPSDRPDGVGALVARLTDPEPGRSRRDRGRDLGALTRAMASSARTAGRASVLGGGWLVDLLVDTVPRIPVRDLTTLREAGFDEAGTVEIVVTVALNVLTNYVNNVAQTDIDFPKVTAKSVA